jgi:hypothetical protein
MSALGGLGALDGHDRAADGPGGQGDDEAQVMLKAINGEITWIQATDILRVTARHMRRMRNAVRHEGFGELVDGRGTRAARRLRLPPEVIGELCRLKREVYPDFSVRHFYEKVTEKHGLRRSYNWARLELQEAGVVDKAPGRGKYHRKRERRPMVGMLVHLDASMHGWIRGLPMWDLVVALDDADRRILHARLVKQEGVASTLEALEAVLRRYGRFCELYTDRGSHFCRTAKAGAAPAEEQNGQVVHALHVLGIRHIRARSPQARGRSERAFGTIQGRLPQELRLNGITSYAQADRYLEEIFVPDFNRRFTVAPAQAPERFHPCPQKAWMSHSCSRSGTIASCETTTPRRVRETAFVVTAMPRESAGNLCPSLPQPGVYSETGGDYILEVMGAIGFDGGWKVRAACTSPGVAR